MGDEHTSQTSDASGGHRPGSISQMLGSEASSTRVSLAAARALLRAHGADEVVEAVARAVTDLGARLGAPEVPGHQQLPIDVSFGVGEPRVPEGDQDTLALLRVVLPAVVQDAQVALGRIRHQEQLSASAGTDALTGVATRRVAMRTLSRLEPGDVVAMVDLDEFKAVNDSHGHGEGDAVLRSFGEALRQVARSADTIGRLGGEEFVLLLPRSSLEGAGHALERLRALWTEERPRTVTFSAGVAAVTASGPRDALKRADRALYTAKAAGRDRVEVAS